MLSRFLSFVAFSAALTALPLSWAAAQTAAHTSPEQPTEVKVDDLVWRELRTFPGAFVAIVQGDPAKEGHFTMRVRSPDGLYFPPHWHNTTEYITVLSGAWLYGTGETADRSSARELPAGTFIVSHAKTPHYAWSKGETVVQVSGMGHMETIFVNPDEDPRRKK